MEDLLAKMEMCMATVDRIAAAGNAKSASNPGRDRVYVSMVKVDGKPILPPLMTAEKRSEMARYKAEAARREKERSERRHQDLLSRVESIVSSYQEGILTSSSSKSSKETSPAPLPSTLPEHASHSTTQEPQSTVPEHASHRTTHEPTDMKATSSEERTKSNPSYSPLKYMEADEDEWNVRPATPWRRAKPTRTRSQLAAKFNGNSNQPISSTMRIDDNDRNVIRGVTPDVSSISFASSRAVSSLSSLSPVEINGSASAKDVCPALKEVLPPGTASGESKEISHHETPSFNPQLRMEPVRQSSAIISEAPESAFNSKGRSSENNSTEPRTLSPEVSEKEISISRLSPIAKVDAVGSLGGGVLTSTGSQSTSSSSNSALNQTVIDLSQMTIAPDETHEGEESSKEGGTGEAVLPQRLALAQAEVQPVMQHRDSEEIVKDDANSVQYLSDTESYMSLLGEYSLLPTPGSRQMQITTKGEGKNSPFFADPTLPETLHLETVPGVSNMQDGKAPQGKLPDVDGSVGDSVKSVDASEYFGSSLGTLAQSCTLPMSLSVTSDSTLQGIDEAWDRSEQNVTPTGTEGALSVTSEDLKFAGMVRAAPVGSETNLPDEMGKLSTNAPKLGAFVPPIGRLDPSSKEAHSEEHSVSKIKPLHIIEERSGVKVESEFKTPLRQHVRKGSYTLDFPSPALLDAEARHQAPHASSVEASHTEEGRKQIEVNEETGQEAKSGSSHQGGDDKLPEELSSELKGLTLDDVTESRVLQLQLSCLEQMQQRLQRQHQDQMEELALQQSQELCLLETEMEGIRRKAAASALGHVEEIDRDPAREAVKSTTPHSANIGNEQSESRSSASAQPVSNSKLHGKEQEKNRAPSPTRELSPVDRHDPTLSPGGSRRKRRFDGSSTEDLVEIPASYIKSSSLSGDGRSHLSLHSPISEKFQAESRRKVTPQDSLESNAVSESLVEVPPSYIRSGSHHKPILRSPTQTRSLATPTGSDNHRRSPISYGRPVSADNALDREGALLSTWSTSFSDAIGRSAHLDVMSSATSTHHLGHSDSFFLTDSQPGEMLDRLDEVQQHEQRDSFRPWSITPSLQMDSRFDQISARVKGYLVRALMKTPKIKAIVKTIRDTQSFLLQFQAETPVKRGKLSSQDTKLAHRVLAQLRAAQYELDDIFHHYPIQHRLAILRQAREQERENFFSKKVSPPSVGEKAKPLSAATRKAMERRQQAKEADTTQAGPKRQKMAPSSQRPKSAAEARVLKPLHSNKSQGRPATAVPPRTSHMTQQSLKPKGAAAAATTKPFPSKPVVVTRNVAKATRSPSRPTSRPTSRLSVGAASQARTTAQRHVKSPARPNGNQSKTKTKSVRRSLYPATVGGTKKTVVQRKQAESRKP